MHFCHPHLKVLAVLSLITTPSFSHGIKLYGLENAKQVTGNARGEYYIQLGAFSKKTNAFQLQKQIHTKTRQQVLVEQTGKRYVVLLGPIQSAQRVRTLANQMSFSNMSNNKTSQRTKIETNQANHPHVTAANTMGRPMPFHQRQPHKTNTIMPTVSTRIDHPAPLLKEPLSSSGWYVGVDLGLQHNELAHSMTVDNGSNFPSPLNVDIFTTNENNQANLGFSGGYRWNKSSRWMPVYYFGLRYNHLFSTSVGQTITQYSLPQFTNYGYDWDVSSDLLLASGKVNLFRANRILPYLSGGLGLARNQTSDYSELAFSGVTPRISPAFGDKSTNHFAYVLGAGVDVNLTRQLILSLGYEYRNLGKVSSGSGVSTWSGQFLNLGSYESNAATLSATYLIN